MPCMINVNGVPAMMAPHPSHVGALSLLLRLILIFGLGHKMMYHDVFAFKANATPHKPSAFLQCPSYSMRLLGERKRDLSLSVSVRNQNTGASNVVCRRKSAEDRKSVLLLNQRKLPKLLLNCRDDAKKALDILGGAYPHLAFSLEGESDDVVDTLSQGETPSYEMLISILYGRDCSMNGAATEDDLACIDVGNESIEDTFIIDGKSVVATIEVFRKAHNVAAAMQLLRLSVEGVRHNKKVATFESETFRHPVREDASERIYLKYENDKNELRRIYKAVFSLLGHIKQGKDGSDNCPRLIMHLLHHHMPTHAQFKPTSEIYHAAINALGKFGACDLILEILEDMEQQYHGSSKLSSNESHDVPPVDKMTYQAAISSLARHGNCRKATQLLYRMQIKGFMPDINTYNELLIGIAKEAGRGYSNTTERGISITSDCENILLMQWSEIALQIINKMEMQKIQPTEQSYNSVISACGKEGEWDAAARVAEKAKLLSFSWVASELGTSGNSVLKQDETLECAPSNENIPQMSKELKSPTTTIQPALDKTLEAIFFRQLQTFRKFGKGNDSWWEIGLYSTFSEDDGAEIPKFHSRSQNRESKPDEGKGIIIGIQPHRNPACNGFSLVFFDKASQVKLGRMLLKNTSSNQSDQNQGQFEPRQYSSLVGMEVNKTRRGEGLSKIFVAIWLDICLETNTYPRAAVMNKPLISYVLKGFNFVPQNGGTRVELIRLKKNDISTDWKDDDYNPQFGLYSSSRKSLQGLFSQRVLRTQNIAVLNQPPCPELRQNGTIIYLKTNFEHPIAILDNAVEYSPPTTLNYAENLQMSLTSNEHDELDRTTLGLQLSEQELSVDAKTSSVQKILLQRQINSILETHDKPDSAGHLIFFANKTLLNDIFSSNFSNRIP